MEQVSAAYKCPRCAVSPHPFIDAGGGAPSRQTMDGREPVVLICGDCRERELFRGSAKLPAIPIERWPVPLAALLEEDALRYRYRRAERVPGDGVLVDPGEISA